MRRKTGMVTRERKRTHEAAEAKVEVEEEIEGGGG